MMDQRTYSSSWNIDIPFQTRALEKGMGDTMEDLSNMNVGCMMTNWQTLPEQVFSFQLAGTA